MSDRPKVLVKEKIAEAGVDLLRERFDVEVGTDWADGELESRIGEFDAIIIRSATKMTPELIGKAGRLRAIGRAGTPYPISSPPYCVTGSLPGRHARGQRRSTTQSTHCVSAVTSSGSTAVNMAIRS